MKFPFMEKAVRHIHLGCERAVKRLVSLSATSAAHERTLSKPPRAVRTCSAFGMKTVFFPFVLQISLLIINWR